MRFVFITLGFLLSAYNSMASDSTRVIFKISNVDSALVYLQSTEPNQSTSFWALNLDSVWVSNGSWDIVLSSPNHEDSLFQVLLDGNMSFVCEYRPNRIVNTKKQEPEKESVSSVDLLIITESKSDVYINNGKLTKGSIVLKAPVGVQFNVKTVSDYGTKTYDVFIEKGEQVSPVNLNTAPSAKDFNKYRLIPGSYDRYKGNKWKAVTPKLLIGAFAAMAIKNQIDFAENRDNFENWSLEYQNLSENRTPSNIRNALRAGDMADSFQEAANKSLLKKNLSLVGVGLIFAANFAHYTKMKWSLKSNQSEFDKIATPIYMLDPKTGQFKLGVDISF